MREKRDNRKRIVGRGIYVTDNKGAFLAQIVHSNTMAADIAKRKRV